MLIRRAEPKDARDLARVHVDAWRTTYAGIVPAEYLDSLSYERRESIWTSILADPDSTSISFAAEEPAGSIVGFGSGGPERENDPVFRGELYAIYIRDTFQGRGIGRSLVSSVAEHLVRSGYRSMLVWVLAENPHRRFYERLGGELVREKSITIGGLALVEVAYGWPDVRGLTEPEPRC